MNKQKVLQETEKILNEFETVTLRQLFYQLVVRQVIQNKQNQYKYLSKILVEARKNGSINEDAIIDETRELGGVQMWDSLNSFLDAIKNSYHKDIWDKQENYIEVWVEKQALASQFKGILDNYRIPLFVSHGFSSYTCIKDAKNRLQNIDKPIFLLLFYDYDRSGETIIDHIKNELEKINNLTIKKIAITPEQIRKYKLPRDYAKPKDKRHLEIKIQVELDALRPDILKQIIRESAEEYFDSDAFDEVITEEMKELKKLEKITLKS